MANYYKILLNINILFQIFLKKLTQQNPYILYNQKISKMTLKVFLLYHLTNLFIYKQLIFKFILIIKILYKNFLLPLTLKKFL